MLIACVYSWLSSSLERDFLSSFVIVFILPSIGYYVIRYTTIDVSYMYKYNNISSKSQGSEEKFLNYKVIIGTELRTRYPRVLQHTAPSIYEKPRGYTALSVITG